jgi:small subunit ribosomal protein S3
MGQKVNPIGFRTGIIRDWDSRWYARKATYRDWVLEDAQVRRFLRRRFAPDAAARRGPRGRNRDAGISRIEIERAPNMLKLTLHTAKPGIIIGRGGRGVEDIRAEIERIVKRKVHINVQEIRQPELDAMLVAENVAAQLERRIAFKRAVRQAIQRSTKMGAKGIRVLLAGRLGGAEMSRRYGDRDGKIPLHTLRADIDYGFTEARTTYGHIGVKVWLYRGDVLPAAPAEEARPERPAAAEKPHKGWRRVGVRKVEPQPEAPAAAVAEGEEAPAPTEEPVIAAAEGQEAPTPTEETVGAPEIQGSPDAGQPAQPEAEAAEPAEAESAAQSEEQSTDVDALQGQVPETTERPQTG